MGADAVMVESVLGPALAVLRSRGWTVATATTLWARAPFPFFDHAMTRGRERLLLESTEVVLRAARQ